MRTGSKVSFLLGFSIVLLQGPAKAANEKPAFKDDKEKASYGIGTYFGNLLKRNNMDVDVDVVVGAMKDVLEGHELKLTEQEGQAAIRAYQSETQRKLAEKNKQQGEAFLAENKNKPGMKTLETTTQDGKPAEMQYKVITEGTGAIPRSNDTVSVNYKGTFIDGKEFDSSAKHGKDPAKFMANRVIRGWTAALEQMKVGSKWELFIPSQLAYGDMGNPNIPPGSTLIFEVELLGIEAPAPAPTPQPLTSDIVKVPSAEEFKKGAKVEIIKPEDAARMAQEAQTNKAGKK